VFRVVRLLAFFTMRSFGNRNPSRLARSLSKKLRIRSRQMNSEEWSRIEALFHGVLDVRSRNHFCPSDDEQLRRQMESLMARADANDASLHDPGPCAVDILPG
jgi:uncharacterized protein YjbK